MIVKMIILRILGSSDDKEKENIGVARPKGPPLRGFRYPVSGRGSRGSRPSRVSGQRPESSSVRSTGRTDAKGIGASDACRKNRRCIGAYHRCNDVSVQGKIPSAPVEPTVQEKGIGALAVLCTRDDVKCPEEVSSAPVQPMGHRCIPPV